MAHRRRLWAGLVGVALAFCAIPGLASARDSVVLSPKSAVPGPSSPPALVNPAGGLLLPLPFDHPDVDRAYWDVPLRRLDPGATAIAVDIEATDPAAVRAVTLHLRAGGHWLSAQGNLEADGRQTLYFSVSDFAAESGNPDWRKADVLRLSAWRGAPRAASLAVLAIRAHSHSIAILRADRLASAADNRLASQCAARAQRLFTQAGLPAAVLTGTADSIDLRPYRLLVLPYNPDLDDRQLDALERFVLRRQGRVAVFYSANDRLARLLGFALRPYASSPEDWHTVDFAADAVPGLPPSMPHRTRHLLPVRAHAAPATTLGSWQSPEGRPAAHLPAAAVSPFGVWFSHVPPLASSSAVQWLLASLAAANAEYRPVLDDRLAQAAQRDAEAARLLESSAPPDGEIRAVWALPISDEFREAAFAALSRRGINVVFEHLATAGHAHYRGESSLLRSDLGDRRSRHFLSNAVAAAHARGIELHAWVVCWNLDGLPQNLVAPLRAQGRLMQNAAGATVDWLCPSHPENQALLLDSLRDLARRGVDGIHLDYVRYPARDGCYAPPTRAAFEKSLGRPVGDWPSAVLPGGAHAEAYEDFRRAEISGFVAAARHAVREINPRIRFSAAVYPTPESAAENGQDWPRWLRDGLLDFAAPMLYASHPDSFARQLDLALAAADPARVVAGIGSGADEAQLDALGAASQILRARQRRVAGFAFFQLDSDLLSRILPAFPD